MITLIITLVVVGFGVFLLNRFLPIDENIKQLINYVVIFVLIVAVVLFVLRLFGVYDGPDMKLN